MKKQPSIEECIAEFIKQYDIQEKNNPDSSKKAYHAYLRMFCEEEDLGDNLANQKKLGEFLHRKGYETGFQHSDDRLFYYHIAGENGIKEENTPNLHKIYINCERKYISIITAAIFKCIRKIAGDKLQMKCISEQMNGYGLDEDEKEIKNYQRNDKIVIYAENEEKAKEICNAISLLKLKNPKVFKGIKKTPLLKNQDGFMVVTSKNLYNYVQTPVGTAAGATFNDYISDILYNSVIATFDKELKIDNNKKKYRLDERMREYSRIFSEMEDEQKNRIIKNCKDLFVNLCNEANIELEENNKQNNKDSYEK